MTADETAPLLPDANPSTSINGNGQTNVANGQDHDRSEPKKTIMSRLLQAFSVENRVLFAGFLITLSFSFTQVP